MSKRKWKIRKDNCNPNWPWCLQTPEGVLILHYSTFAQAVLGMNSAIKGEGLLSLMY